MTATSADSLPVPRPDPAPVGPGQDGYAGDPARSDALAGFTVAVTSDRRRDEIATRLAEHGVRIVLAPALRLVPVADDTPLYDATRRLLESAPDVVVGTTVIGMLGWLEAADGWGLGDALRARLADAHVVARWPRPGSELRSAGLAHAWSPATESVAEIVEHLAARFTAGRSGARSRRSARLDEYRPLTSARGSRRGPLAGRRVAVQLHGVPEDELCAALVAAGAEVVEVPVHRWAPPVDPTPLQRLIDLITSHLVDAVTFTSAVAVGSVLRTAGPDADAVLTALRGPVLVGCLGPQAADPLRRVNVPVLVPPRARASALVATLVDELPRRTHTLRVAGCEVVLRGHAAVVDGVLKPLPPAQMAILRSLAAAPGRVLPRSQLLEALPRGADEHAVEMAVARLRAALGRPSFIETVVKRGYRLRVD
ncbi:MAG: uroporphyrinogen-III synthase [Micromonosporaceae bacterium]|nr:uroporphyrinogen-III synthase [Micromonosporaceae bacterium]